MVPWTLTTLKPSRIAKKKTQVTLPDGVKAGDTIHVQAPSGKTNAIVVPSGFGPGSTFTVEFADETQAPPPANNKNDNYNAPAASSTASTPSPPAPAPSNLPDDGFATGFQNPHWQPTATPVSGPEVHVSHSAAAHDGQHGNYPSATATPVYTP